MHHAANGRAVYSFRMSPGGTVVAATAEAVAPLAIEAKSYRP